ncbi:DEAD/DEAH box helicase [Inquilinus sp. OTU3971]|uniref:DEAD/DEAH box helicase n=1 Tax=Inquilinus sp. OTU3971 TaxID=3043855 RepID=UPI00313EF8D2
MPEAETAKLLEILAYWHRIEFFIPFDLRQVTEEKRGECIAVASAGLADKTAIDLWDVSIGEDEEIAGFNLYLGIFAKAEIDQLAKRLHTNAVAGTEESEDAERADTEGDTCFARLKLTPGGVPDLDSVSVSTVPWAIGRANHDEWDALTDQNRADAFADLGERLRGAETKRLLGADGKQAAGLSGSDLTSLIGLLQDWACFSPKHSDAAVLQVVTKKKKKKRISERPGPTHRAADQTGPEHAEAGEKPADGDDDEIVATDTGIDILNSFYIRDLERAMAALRRGDVPAALAAYLDPPASKRIDLYSGEGRRAILDMLHPGRLPSARWLRTPGQAMSLMQQFAINAALERLGADGVFSVNGPPGTGKTTLLGDIVAEIIVRRARALAGFETVADTMINASIRAAFARSDAPAWIRQLSPELVGHEMVVGSSNNTAVENISKDLPKRKALGEGWRNSGYLRPVAHKVVVQQGNGRFKEPADLDDAPWGLISCALGKFANRRDFADRVFFRVDQRGRRPALRDPAATIREWIDAYDGPSFPAAALSFREADQAVSAQIAALAQQADIAAEMLSSDGPGIVSAAAAKAEAAGTVQQTATTRLATIEAELAQCSRRLAELAEEERLIDRQSPGRLAWLFRPSRHRAFKESRRANAEEQLSRRRRLRVLEAQAASASATLATATAALDAARSARDAAAVEWSRKQDRWKDLQDRLGLSELTDLEKETIQERGLWHDDRLAELRSTLFNAALALHEAWLAEAGRNKDKGGHGFGGNLVAISRMLKGARPINADYARVIWQSLFMVVPVVSSTFASFGRQFQDLGPGDIGWLFIDEAGQAPPQAAVGALWRARRAVVVGDPLQIEPVYTVPARLIEALAGGVAAIQDGRYAPNRVSVQQLADRANPYGAMVPANDRDESIWIGSPLRVHRRCARTMFDIANAIAYDGKMIFATRPDEDGYAGWVDVAGLVREGRQVVPEQIEIAVQAVLDLYRIGRGVLPPLYLISPFRSVKQALTRRLTDIECWNARLDPLGLAVPKRTDLANWCKERIGTVHTFQGKEEFLVLMVLGADHAHANSADWASSKPNLLNVAATRAKRGFFIIGDRSLWGGKPYFRTARDKLRCMSPQDFLDDLGNLPAAP